MKHIAMILALLSLSAFAADQATPAAAAPAVAPETKVAPEAKPAKAKKAHVTKAMKAEAKAACIQENVELEKDKKGLKACIKGKLAEKK